MGEVVPCGQGPSQATSADRLSTWTTRCGEIVGLTWDRVDVKRGFITLRSLDTKTKTARQVPMTPDVKVILQRLARTGSLATRHVFTYKGRPLQRVSRSFKTALVEAGITDFRFHDLRHCASTNLRRAGVDTVTAMKIVGHKSEKMWKRYNAIEEHDLTQAAESWISSSQLTPY